MKNLMKTITMAALMLAVFLCAAGTIYADGPSISFTDVTGQAKFEDLPIGIYDVIVSMDGYYSKQTTAEIVALESQNHVIVNVELDEITEGSITATIKDEDNNPVQNAAVTIGGNEILTDADGKAVFSNLPVGDYDITVYKDGYYTLAGNASIIALEGQEHPSADFTLQAITKGTVSTVIKDGNGDPISNVTIIIGGIEISTDENGEAELPDLPVGTYEVEIKKDGYHGQTTEITIDAIDGLDSVALNITLEKITSGSITVIVKDTNGNFIGDATVEIQSR